MYFFCLAVEKRQETRDDKVHIGVTYYNQSDTFLNELLARFKEQLKNPEHEELEATVTILDAAGSQRTQDDQVKELIDMGCDVLCVNLVDRADPSENYRCCKKNMMCRLYFLTENRLRKI